ncbi:MAG TPA: hypothetical protein VFW73_13810 [Lacipirellulaceae bacterium]|nr:hypothetical protein [Lacipirellulaceae bacterium]
MTHGFLFGARRIAYNHDVEANRGNTSGATVVTRNDYFALAGLLEGRESIQRVQKKDPHAEGLRRAGEQYANRAYVAAYQSLRPIYDKVVSDMQRVLARNSDFEAHKLASQQRKPLAAAKEIVQAMKAHAQQVIDQFDTLLHDLESKALVRAFIRKAKENPSPEPKSTEESSPVASHAVEETPRETSSDRPSEIVSGTLRFRRENYSPPSIGSTYSVRDKDGSERIIRVLRISDDGTRVQVVTIEAGLASPQPVQVSVDSLKRQATKGWCRLLVPIGEFAEAPTGTLEADASNCEANLAMRLDSQNFGRCCADIARANIKFSTQLIKDVADGPFRARNYEQAFLTFEQLAVGFNSAVASSRRAIADGRRILVAEKGKMSGKEIQERTAAFIRSEQLIHTAEREFSTILEGLRMYLSAQQGRESDQSEECTDPR